MRSKLTHKVFVYGSLRRGLGNWNRYLNQEGAQFITEDTLENCTMYSLGAFPGVVPKGTTQIFGEIFVVDDETLKSLDELEGHPYFYKRTEVMSKSGEKVFTYFYQGQRLNEEVCSGDWLQHLKEFFPNVS